MKPRRRCLGRGEPSQDAMQARRHAAHPGRDEQADHRPRAWRGAGRRHGAGFGLRHLHRRHGAVFATSEVKFGIIPSAISPYVIRAIGARQAYRYFQTAERIGPPARAVSWGWPTRRLRPTHSMPKCRTCVDRAAAGRPEVTGRGQGSDPRRGQSADHRRTGRRHRPPHCQPARHARSPGRPRRLPRQAPGVPGCRARGDFSRPAGARSTNKRATEVASTEKRETKCSTRS
jgi:enoyl-CoA hydratase/carnithine racemase